MLTIHTIPAFQDNYLWLFHRPGQRRAYVVDPGDATPVQAALKNLGLELAGILVTHHHPDHTGGIEALRRGRDIPVYGPHSQRIPAVTHPLADGDRLTLDALDFRILAVPGHTLDHIAYHCADDAVLFCGDTLFAAGCGRMFEGQPQQMQASLQKLASLPAATRVYCAHEYTAANLRFALAVEPRNPALQARAEQVRQQREAGHPTVPSQLAEELQTNPFLRVTQPAVIDAACRYTGGPVEEPADVFAALRRWKDNF